MFIHVRFSSQQFTVSSDTTVIPAHVRAKVSIRIVPEQDLDAISKSLVDHIQASFKELKSPNALKVG